MGWNPFRSSAARDVYVDEPEAEQEPDVKVARSSEWKHPKLDLIVKWSGSGGVVAVGSSIHTRDVPVADLAELIRVLRLAGKEASK
jgi:hypothetical protein